MAEPRVRRSGELNSKRVMVQLPDGAANAFGDLAAALRFDDDISEVVLATVEDLAAGKKLSIKDMISALHMVAEPVLEHVRANGDARALKAWHEIGHRLLEEDVTVATQHVRAR